MGNRNEGEGNRTAAKEYNADQQKFVKDPQKVKDAAEAAKQALNSDQRAELEKAEKEGLKHVKR